MHRQKKANNSKSKSNSKAKSGSMIGGATGAVIGAALGGVAGVVLSSDKARKQMKKIAGDVTEYATDVLDKNVKVSATTKKSPKTTKTSKK